MPYSDDMLSRNDLFHTNSRLEIDFIFYYKQRNASVNLLAAARRRIRQVSTYSAFVQTSYPQTVGSIDMLESTYDGGRNRQEKRDSAMSMIRAERIEAIKQVLQEKKIMSTTALCKHLYCSRSTLHRDLVEMESAGLVRRSRGAVSLIADRSFELPTEFRMSKNQEKKDLIARIAKQHLTNDCFIFLDSSTTVKALSRYIHQLNNVSIVTYSISMANELAQYPNLNVLIPGGRIVPGHDAMLGALTIKNLEDFYFDLAIFSCKSMDMNGTYEAQYDQALIKKSVLSQTRQSLLVCDSTKIGDSSFYFVAKPKAYSVIITDPELTEEQRNIHLAEANVES